MDITGRARSDLPAGLQIIADEPHRQKANADTLFHRRFEGR